MMQRVKQWMRGRSWLAKGIVIALAVAALVALLPLGISAFALAPHQQATTSGWTISHDATAGAAGDSLSAAATIVSNDAWVGGYHISSKETTTLFEHWNGTKWSIVGSPNPGNEGNEISAMAADRSTDVWAVGFYYSINTDGEIFPLVEHWNGVRWYSIFNPVPTGSILTELTGVAALSATDAWITGNYEVNSKSGIVGLPFIEHWNGVRWSFVALPGNSSSYYLNALKGLSGSNVWAVGSQSTLGPNQPVTMHWDGVRWKVIPTAHAGIGGNLRAIVAITSTDIWAVGDELPNTHSLYRTLAEHWNGSSWQVVYTPTINPNDYTFLTGVAATSSNTVWAVGYTTPNSESTEWSPFIDEWNGKNWTAVSIPVGPSMTASSQLLGISATPEGGVWAAGFFAPVRSQSDETLILRHS